ncbi:MULTISPECIES: alcohol dehydrogenase [Metallosphaera]|uniref:Alcohol dehydrogenase GroES domain protein n=3 Tax=Metallosphaera TaxID=41980 RepID=A4YIK6_METS5|nr:MULTISPECIES: alcohol dehydrogenase [Metallosphaera]ABP96258.1 Alcohol dehydrogenase GroES domain protein [Metallosphaera sedula DSM 5348]AIM28241.1 Alcohol dehydrogenase GroES domain protein [Metallosphaera sedula]AKV75049.1 alcohol dehydrogenase [Metallosphaera sedula]AKV77288.1 alcohol dehydrogenase [Metallosphaera sedula]AKV79538.1 alcohol dehydrogenase [Metallosphaera sedula]
MKSIVFNQGIIEAEVPEIPVNRNFVEISTEEALIDGIENGIYLGLIWVRPGTILGGVGLGRVRDVGVDVDESLIGKLVLVTPFSKAFGGIGTEIHGVLAERAVIPADSLVSLPEGMDERALLLPFVSMALEIREKVRGGSVLAIGNGLLTRILADLVSDLAIIEDDDTSSKRSAALERTWDYVVVSTIRGWARHLAEKLISPGGKIIIPKFMNSWPPLTPRSSEMVYPFVRKDAFKHLDSKESEKLLKNFIGKSDNIIASIPTSKPGIIVSMKKLNRNS